MKTTRFYLALACTTLAAQADPQLSTWITAYSSKYARIYTSDANRVAGTTATTWTNGRLTQSLPAYCGIQSISYSDSWIYFSTTNLGPYTMGPWYDDAARTTTFVNLPVNQNISYRIPRTSTLGTPPATKSSTQGMEDAVGFFLDGVAMFDPGDGFTYAGGTEASPGTGQWHRDAYANEYITFDPGNTHQQNTGKYHNHANPLALRYMLGDHVDYNTSTKLYSESTTTATKHSPILGWMRDGYPIYGPYGYSSPLNAASGVRRMIGGFVKRDGTTTGVDNITTAGRGTLPTWATRNNGGITGSGPAVSTTYPLGRYIEDWAYLGDLVKSGTTKYQVGTDFDLNEYNVRYCVTPEFPGGTYAYFINISAAGVPNFPCNSNRYFFGNPTGGTLTPTETVTTYFTGGAGLKEAAAAPTVASASGNVTLTWSSVEGGTYKVEASDDLSTWTALSATQAAASNAIATSFVEAGAKLSHTRRFYRVSRTALASYDTGTTTGTGTGSTITISPTSGTRGTTVSITATISSSATPTIPPQSGAPVSSFTIGTLTVTGAAYTYSANGGVVTGSLVIPSGASTGVQTATITFSPPPGQTQGPTYTQASAFTVK